MWWKYLSFHYVKATQRASEIHEVLYEVVYHNKSKKLRVLSPHYIIISSLLA